MEDEDAEGVRLAVRLSSYNGSLYLTYMRFGMMDEDADPPLQTACAHIRRISMDPIDDAVFYESEVVLQLNDCLDVRAFSMSAL